MAIISNVIVPPFFSEKRPFVLVQFIEEFENPLQTAITSNPPYFNFFNVKKLYPNFVYIHDAVELFKKEYHKGYREDIKLYKFSIKDLTQGLHTKIEYLNTHNRYVNDNIRIATYEWLEPRHAAQEILEFCIENRFFDWND